MRQELLADQGHSGETWSVFLDDALPDEALCTAVAVVVFTDDTLDEVVVIKNLKRNTWEPPAGHVEPDDVSIEHAARREAFEEAGVCLGALQLYGYTEIRWPSGSSSGYPPDGYVPIFWAIQEGERVDPTGDDVDGLEVVTARSLVEQTCELDMMPRNRTLFGMVVAAAQESLR